MSKQEAETIITDTFKRFQIKEYDVTDFNSLSEHFIINCADSILSLEESISNLNFEECDVLTLMDFHYCSYNSEVFLEVYNVIRMIYEGGFNTDIARSLNITQNHVELIQYILCDKKLVDYGTSPRGCWLSGLGKPLFELMREYQNILDATIAVHN